MVNYLYENKLKELKIKFKKELEKNKALIIINPYLSDYEKDYRLKKLNEKLKLKYLKDSYFFNDL